MEVWWGGVQFLVGFREALLISPALSWFSAPCTTPRQELFILSTACPSSCFTLEPQENSSLQSEFPWARQCWLDGIWPKGQWILHRNGHKPQGLGKNPQELPLIPSSQVLAASRNFLLLLNITTCKKWTLQFLFHPLFHSYFTLFSHTNGHFRSYFTLFSHSNGDFPTAAFSNHQQFHTKIIRGGCCS